MNTKGFTLIELLVVVLIIGILSAVALPQYQNTVLKSRTAEAWSNLSAAKTAGNLYCLENSSAYSSWSTVQSELSIEISDSKNFTYGGELFCSATATGKNPSLFWASYSKGGTSFKVGYNILGQRVCDGDVCPKLGFGKSMSNPGSNCLCGGNASACYYMD